MVGAGAAVAEILGSLTVSGDRGLVGLRTRESILGKQKRERGETCGLYR